MWEQLAKIFGKKDDLKSYQLENELISLNLGNSETINEFFTKFMHLVPQLKQCEVEKKYDEIIISNLSKLGLDYFVFVSTFHIENLIILNWKMLTLNAFIESLTNEHDKLVQMGSLRYSKDQDLFT